MTPEELATKAAIARQAEAQAANEARHAKVQSIADARQQAALSQQS